MLVSDDLLAQAALPAGLQVEKLPTLTVRGHTQPLTVSALTRSPTSP